MWCKTLWRLALSLLTTTRALLECSANMKAVTMFFFLFVLCASEALAQEAFNEGDTLRFLTIDAGVADHSAIATGALFNVVSHTRASTGGSL